jgi:hypothetical protein
MASSDAAGMTPRQRRPSSTVTMLGTGWMMRPAENAASAASIAGMRRPHVITARTSASSSCIIANPTSARRGASRVGPATGVPPRLPR